MGEHARRQQETETNEFFLNFPRLVGPVLKFDDIFRLLRFLEHNSQTTKDFFLQLRDFS